MNQMVHTGALSVPTGFDNPAADFSGSARNAGQLWILKIWEQIAKAASMAVVGGMEAFPAEEIDRHRRPFHTAYHNALTAEIRRLLIERYGVDAKRLDIVGRGWEEPAGPDSAQNRRVEVQWFTIE